MNYKWMWVGMLALVIAGEPACNRKEAPISPVAATQACNQDTVEFKSEIGDDAFIDHLRAIRTGDISQLDSVIHLRNKWEADDCLKQTGQPADLIAKDGLYNFYEEHCQEINPTVQDIRDLIHEAATTRDPEDAQMMALAYICYNIHHVDKKEDSLPSTL